jgi:hypothetical protein
MPQKITMNITNLNTPTVFQKHIYHTASLAGSPSIAAPKAPTALNAPILARIHNVRAGCGSCGKH